jgi:hypothetical protein
MRKFDFNSCRQFWGLLVLSLSLVFLFSSCSDTNSNQKENDHETPDSETVGGKKDEHGCLTAAGYTWSQVKNECVRIFEAGIRLNPQDSSLDQTTSAFIIFNNDQSKAELFLPGQEGSLLLDRTGTEGNYQWIHGDYALSAWKGYVLKQDNRTLYHGQ